MKKVTFTFVVSDKVAKEIENEIIWGKWANAFSVLEEKSKNSKYDCEEYEG